MSTFTVTTRMTHRYLMNRTKEELCSLIDAIFDGEEARLKYTIKLVDEAERVLLALQQDGLPVGKYPHLEQAIKNVKYANALEGEEYYEFRKAVTE